MLVVPALIFLWGAVVVFLRDRSLASWLMLVGSGLQTLGAILFVLTILGTYIDGFNFSNDRRLLIVNISGLTHGVGFVLFLIGFLLFSHRFFSFVKRVDELGSINQFLLASRSQG